MNEKEFEKIYEEYIENLEQAPEGVRTEYLAMVNAFDEYLCAIEKWTFRIAFEFGRNYEAKAEAKKGQVNMTVDKIFALGIINDDTEVFIRWGNGFYVLAHGNWYQDNVLKYCEHEAESFAWQDDNKLYIDVKCGVE